MKYEKALADIRESIVLPPKKGDPYKADPALWVREVVGFKPDKWQSEVLNSRGSKVMLNVSRQAGKTAVASLVALHRARYYPNSLVLMVSHSLRQSGVLFESFKHYLGILTDIAPRGVDRQLSCKLTNGSRVISLPDSEGTVRGYSAVDLLIIDEAFSGVKASET